MHIRRYCAVRSSIVTKYRERASVIKRLKLEKKDTAFVILLGVVMVLGIIFIWAYQPIEIIDVPLPGKEGIERFPTS